MIERLKPAHQEKALPPDNYRDKLYHNSGRERNRTCLRSTSVGRPLAQFEHSLSRRAQPTNICLSSIIFYNPCQRDLLPAGRIEYYTTLSAQLELANACGFALKTKPIPRI